MKHVCVICHKTFKSRQPKAKYCNNCRHKKELLRQKRRYFESGVTAIREILKNADNYFLKGCEDVYIKIAGVKLDKNNKMVQERIKQLNKVLENIEAQIERLKEFVEE